jgi:hypothetical protein
MTAHRAAPQGPESEPWTRRQNSSLSHAWRFDALEDRVYRGILLTMVYRRQKQNITPDPIWRASQVGDRGWAAYQWALSPGQ